MTENVFQQWFVQKEKNQVSFLIYSFVIHVLLIALCFYFIKKEYVTTEESGSSGPVKIHFESKKDELKNQKSPLISNLPVIPQRKKILASPDSSSKTSVYEKKIPMGIQRFLPQSNPDFLTKLRNNSHNNQEIDADDGDIPVQDDNLLTPRMTPKMLSHYEHKEMSLFQFSQEFRQKFSAIWNQKDRFIPPASPLRAGEVIYYKIYIHHDGTLFKYENLTAKKELKKDFSHIDEIFVDVITQTLPMRVPKEFTSSKILTEIVAIQVVDRNSPFLMTFH